jgi:hypothetical protein
MHTAHTLTRARKCPLLHCRGVLYFMATASSNAKTNSFNILVIKGISFLFGYKCHAKFWYPSTSMIFCSFLGILYELIINFSMDIVAKQLFLTMHLTPMSNRFPLMYNSGLPSYNRSKNLTCSSYNLTDMFLCPHFFLVCGSTSANFSSNT